MTERVTVGAADLGAPAPAGPNDAAMAAKADAAAAAATAPPAERPAWLPEKFKTVEDMAKAYGELEGKQAAPAKTEEAPKVPAEEAPKTPTDDEAAKAVADAGLNFDDLGRQIATDGDISKEARAALVAKGIPESAIDTHVSGVKAQMELAVTKAYEHAGGQEQFQAMSEWAGTQAEEGQLAAYNALVEKGDPASISAAMKYLSDIYTAANGKSAQRRVEGSANGAPSNDVYASRQQVTADMRNPLYKTDPAFRAQVEQKVARSSVL